MKKRERGEERESEVKREDKVENLYTFKYVTSNESVSGFASFVHKIP